jgi:hypothetical protein
VPSPLPRPDGEVDQETSQRDCHYAEGGPGFGGHGVENDPLSLRRGHWIWAWRTLLVLQGGVVVPAERNSKCKIRVSRRWSVFRACERPMMAAQRWAAGGRHCRRPSGSREQMWVSLKGGGDHRRPFTREG